MNYQIVLLGVKKISMFLSTFLVVDIKRQQQGDTSKNASRNKKHQQRKSDRDSRKIGPERRESGHRGKTRATKSSTSMQKAFVSIRDD